jgi:dsDNA-specific endonuclease/ATPase MutS2
LEDFIPIVAIVATFSIPVVAILTYHQRKMTELIHGKANQQQSLQVESQRIENEVRELRQLVHQQTIAIDDIRKKLDALGARHSDEMTQRLGG